MSLKVVDRYSLIWLGAILLTIFLIYLQNHVPWLLKYPDYAVLPISNFMNYGMNFIVAYFGRFFLGISWFLEFPIKASQFLLHSLPWTVIVFLVSTLAYFASGLRLSLFTALATLYMVFIGYWEESMNTLALVLISVPLAIFVGFGILFSFNHLQIVGIETP